MSYDNTNRGAIWGNDRKEKDTHPDFKGEANIDGTDYWVSAWKRKPDANPKAPALSFSFTRKEERAVNEAFNKYVGGEVRKMQRDISGDDGIPF